MAKINLYEAKTSLSELVPGEIEARETRCAPQSIQGAPLFLRQADGLAHVSSSAFRTARQNARVRPLSSG